MLAAPVTVSFGVAQASTERLQQLLAQLGYLPLAFTATGTPAPNAAATAQPGTFAWRWTTLPPDLTSLWTEGSENVITKAAVMTFQSQNGLSVDGLAGQKVWSALLAATSSGKTDTSPYNYVLVNKQLPQNLTLYENGAPTMTGVAVNTGAPGADTVDGTYPVFEHVPSSRMQGTNPDGSTYDDPDGALGQLLQRGRCPSRLRTRHLRITPEQRVRGDAHRHRRPGVAAHAHRHAGHRGGPTLLSRPILVDGHSGPTGPPLGPTP